MKQANSNPIVLVFTVFVGVGLLLLIQYGNFPIVRNSLIYAAIIQGINDFDLWHAAQFAQNKPMGFSILSLPFSQIWGVNLGLKISSWFWTLCFGLMVILFIKHLAHQSSISKNSQQVNDAILLSLFNPLLFYQFISAYPDSLFAALFLASILSIYYLLSIEGHVVFSVLAFVVMLMAIWVKHHGLILIPILVIMMFKQKTEVIQQWQQQNRRIKFSIIIFLVFLAIVNDAQQGYLSLFNMSQNNSNFLGGANRVDIVQTNLENFLVFILISFNFLSPVLLYLPTYQRQYGLLLPLLLIFILPILYYAGSQYNIRYFIAILPILAWIIAKQLQYWPKKLRHFSINVFILSNILITANYHHLTFNQWLHQYVSLPEIDNLRLLSEQQVEKQNITSIKQYAKEHDNTLLFFSDYYFDATFGVWQQAGLLPADLTIIYCMGQENEIRKMDTIKSAVVYEYIGIGSTINSLPQQSQFSPYMRKLNDQLYLLNRNHKL